MELSSIDYSKLPDQQQNIDSVIKNIKSQLTYMSRNLQGRYFSFLTDSRDKLLFCGGPGSIQIYDLATLSSKSILKGHQFQVTHLVLHKNILYSACKDCSIASWDIQKGKQIHKNHPHKQQILRLQVAKQSQELITISSELFIRFWHLSNLFFSRQLPVTSPPCDLVLLEESHTILFACQDGIIKIHDLIDLSLKNQLRGNDCSCICFLPQYQMLAGAYNTQIKVWSLSSLRVEYVLQKHTQKILKLTCTKQAKYLFSNSEDFSIIIWDLVLKTDLISIKNESLNTIFGLSAMCTYMITGNQKEGIKVWNLQEQGRVHEFAGVQHKVRTIGLKMLRNIAITSGNDNTVCQWDINAKAMTRVTRIPCELILYVDPHPTEPVNLIATIQNQILFWNVQFNKAQKSVFAHNSKIIFLTWLSKSTFLSVSMDGEANFWDINQQNRTQSFNLGIDIYYITINSEKTHILYSNGDTVRLYDLNSSKVAKSIRMDTAVTCLHIGTGKKYIGVGLGNGQVLILDFLSFAIEMKLKQHISQVTSMVMKDSKHLITGSADHTLKVWNLQLRLLYGSVLFKARINCIVQTSDSFLLIGVGRRLVLMKNPLCQQKVTMLGPSVYSLPFALFLKKILDQELQLVFYLEMTRWMIMPYGINLLHLYCYYGNAQLVKQSLLGGCVCCRNLIGSSPLSISIQRQSYNCIQIIAKNIGKYMQNFPGAFDSFQNEIVQLNQASPVSLHRFYETAFQTPDQPGLPSYACLKASPPVVFLSPTPKIDPRQFIDRGTEQKVKFKTTLFKMNFLIGSQSSMEFLRSLIECENNDVFRTPFIQSLITYKWNIVKRFIWFRGVVFLCLSVFLLYSLLDQKKQQWPLWLILFLDPLFLTFQILQMAFSFKNYIKDFWNIIDFIMIILLGVYCLNELKIAQMITENMRDSVETILLLFVWVHAITYLRTFRATRHLLRMIEEVIKDMIPFLIVFIFATFGFTFIFMILKFPTGNFNQAFMHVYGLDYGNFQTQNYTSFQEWMAFLLASIINPLILLNLLIAIMGDTYDKVQELQDVTDYREMAYVIFQFESLLFWRRKSGEKTYFQECSDCVVLQTGMQWQGRIKALKNQLTKISGNQSRNEKFLTEQMLKMQNQIKELQDLTNNRFQSLETSIEKLSYKIRNK